MDTTRLFSRMRSLLTIAKAGACASTFSMVLGGLPCAALAANDPMAEASPGQAQDHTPSLVFGGGVGYASHFGRTVSVDAVTGASTPAHEFREHGVALSAFADASAIQLGRGNLGVLTGFTITFPETFKTVALVPRYRLRFALADATIRSAEPWLGLGVALAFRDHIRSRNDYFLWFPVSVGCDFQLGSGGLYGGIGVDVNMVNPKGVDRGAAGEDHLNNVVVLLRLSYRVL